MSLINTRVLMSDARQFNNQLAINPYYTDEVVDIDSATLEHQSIKQALETVGVEVVQVASPSGSQDGVYTANWALLRGKKAILAKLPKARHAEEEYAKGALQNLGFEVILPPEGLKFSGQGDALACGDYLFCGQGYRSDELAQAFAAESLGYERIQLQTVPQLDTEGEAVINQVSGWPDSFYYDIDLALSIIAGPSEHNLGIIAYCPAAFTAESQEILKNLSDFDKIIVSEVEAKQAFACNLLSTGESVVMSARAPRLQAELESRGFTVITPKIAELSKGGGYIRCTTLTLSN